MLKSFVGGIENEDLEGLDDVEVGFFIPYDLSDIDIINENVNWLLCKEYTAENYWYYFNKNGFPDRFLLGLVAHPGEDGFASCGPRNVISFINHIEKRLNIPLTTLIDTEVILHSKHTYYDDWEDHNYPCAPRHKRSVVYLFESSKEWLWHPVVIHLYLDLMRWSIFREKNQRKMDRIKEWIDNHGTYSWNLQKYREIFKKKMVCENFTSWIMEDGNITFDRLYDNLTEEGDWLEENLLCTLFFPFFTKNEMKLLQEKIRC